MKFLRAASQCLRVCVYARVCVCVRVCERVSFVLSFYQKHTRQINQMSQRDETGRRHTSSFPLSLLSLLMMTNSRLLNMFSVCATVCVCVCIVQAASLLRSTAANFQGRVLLAPLPLSTTSSTSFCWHTRTTHTPPQQLCTSLCVRVCEAINLMIY